MRSALGGVLVLAMLLGAGCGGGEDDGASATSDACKEGCVQTVAADCSMGPESQQQCESDCRALASGTCASEYQALQACAEGEQVTCNSAGLPTVSACLDET